MALKYTTQEKFNRALEANKYIPDYPVTTSQENVGTGDTSTTVFYLSLRNRLGQISNHFNSYRS